ncbi:MAG: hypothetical protein IKW57_04470 [Alphaproteobacteria bacterium]|nr:hypothetical protein [Alphaproteobacteria bacterium]
MKKISWFATVLAICGGVSTANAKYDDAKFQAEILTGLDLIGARETIEETPEYAPGELGREVYEIAGAVQPDDIQMYIPTSMYVRMGMGLNLGFATDSAMFNGTEYESSGSYTTQIGLGWNLSSYVRAELDFQNSLFKFSDMDNHQATYQTVGGMLYFDLARRYVQNGDITRRRTFVPFVGIGAGFGTYEFQGMGGADGFVIAAPRATAGFNIMFTDLIGIDIAYQYQMMIGNGFGWNVRAGGVDNISNIIASFRMNF